MQKRHIEKLAIISTKLRLLWALERKSDYYDLIEQYYQHSPIYAYPMPGRSKKMVRSSSL